MQRKLIQAQHTHLATGLTIAVHRGDGNAAFEQLNIWKSAGCSLKPEIGYTAQTKPNKEMHIKAGQLKT